MRAMRDTPGTDETALAAPGFRIAACGTVADRVAPANPGSGILQLHSRTPAREGFLWYVETTMHQPLESTGIYEAALTAAELGIAAIPCRPGTKVPLVKWTRYQHELPTKELLKRWFENPRNNIAI